MIVTANQELITRLSVFMGVLMLMLLWEKRTPRRPCSQISWRRRVNNLILLTIDTLLIRLFMPLAAVSMAAIAVIHDWGLFNLLDLNPWLAGIISFLILDVLIYFQHRLFHKYSLLWRLHRVHHSDTEFDLTTGIRFHPVEIFISMCIKILAVMLIGAPVLSVIVFEIVLSATSLFNHGNVRIPDSIDHHLRWLLVTPDMHRVHHSAINKETNSNFGFNIPWWDRLFGTYRDQPKLGHEKLKVGLNEFRDERFVNVLWLLKQPLLNSAEFADNRDTKDTENEII
ncbi:MAG: sterol desaturase/sphingolipid hydroxylase (fatty acid hydroxylase superfamily) [Planctomycetota bacterium]|jgi:sterol desaturase/sphingolipid hydroxylase (fatty acid hydroxylase superfamily)